MDYGLTPDLQMFLGKMLINGRYAKASDVICEALHLLRQREDKLAAVDAAIASGLAEAERGEGKDSNAVFDRLEQKYRTMAEVPAG